MTLFEREKYFWIDMEMFETEELVSDLLQQSEV